jgi:hypothetical protein
MNDTAREPPLELHDAHVRAWEEHTGRRAADANTDTYADAERDAIQTEGASDPPWAEMLARAHPGGKPIYDASYDQAAAMRRAAPKYVREASADAQPSTVIEWRAPLDLAALATQPVPERIYRVGNIMLTGTTGLITGHGGSGKTQLGLHLGACFELGRHFFGETVRQCRAAFISAEDDARDLHYRLVQQAAQLKVSLADLAGFFVYDVSQDDATLIVDDGENVGATARYWALQEELARRGVEAVVLDNLAALCAGNINDPRYATRALALLGKLVPASGNTIVLAHVDKALAKAGYGAQAYSGTAAWHNRARWRWFLCAPNREDDKQEDGLPAGPAPTEDDGSRILEVQKNNAGPIGHMIPLRFVGPTLTGDGVPFGVVASIERANERKWLLRTLAEAEDRGEPVFSSERANRNAHAVLTAISDCPKALRGRPGKRTLFPLLLRLKAEGLLGEKTNYTLSRNHVMVWTVTPKGREEAC